MRNLPILLLILTSSCAAYDALLGTGLETERTARAVADTAEGVRDLTLDYVLPWAISIITGGGAAYFARRAHKWKQAEKKQRESPIDTSMRSTT